MHLRVLIVEAHRNGAGLADRLARENADNHVVLVTGEITPGAWSNNRVKIVEASGEITDIVELARQEAIDLVVNYNPVYGVGGLCEALRQAGTSVIGSGQRLSATEIHKQEFKDWLAQHGFSTPHTLYRGRWDEIQDRAPTLNYPIVIKPDVQAGPPVSVCDDANALRLYLDNIAEKVPYAKFAIIFSIEAYVAIVEHFHIGYFLCGGKGYVDIGVRIPTLREGGRSALECPCVLMRHPRNAFYSAEIDRFIQAMTEFGDGALATVQCGLTSDGELHFIEHNARPGTDGGALTAFGDALTGLQCLQNGDSNLLRQYMVPIEQGVMVAISLLHKGEAINVDLEALSNLPGMRFFPSSISRQGGRYVSRRQGIPSVLTVEGTHPSEILTRIEGALTLIAGAGDFLPINLATVRRLIET